ncbi:MAG: exo-alpha-sialidase [Candidatus Competibacteraceae bacterium]|nr:exo-alpha-sialidase [Candidatus Competibacteraceae bacterium]
MTPTYLKGLMALTLWITPITAMHAQEPFHTNVFSSNTEGYNTFRIPAIVRATNGDLLAFVEARKNNATDTGDIDLVLRRSTDAGTTWSALQLVGDLGGRTYGNPTPIVASDGTIHLLTTSNHGSDTKPTIWAGTSNDIRRVHYQKSTDHGATWSAPTEITAQATKAGEDWRWYATGRSTASSSSAAARGRLIVPCNHSDHSFNPGATDRSTNAAHILYSDDDGATWQVGGEMHTTSSNIRPWESTAVELVDGRVYLNARNEGIPLSQPRVGAYSDDGGGTLGPSVLVEDLIEPRLHYGVQGALLRFSATDRGGRSNRILFSNPAALSTRRRMTVKSSFDETASWNWGRVIDGTLAGYSDMVKLDKGGIGILYEAGEQVYHERIDYVRFSEAWLDLAEHLGVFENFDSYSPGSLSPEANGGQGFALRPGWTTPTGGTVTVVAAAGGNAVRVTPQSGTTSLSRDLATTWGRPGETCYISVNLRNVNGGTRFFGLSLLRDDEDILLIGGKDQLVYSVGIGNDRASSNKPSTTAARLVVRIDSQPRPGHRPTLHRPRRDRAYRGRRGVDHARRGDVRPAANRCWIRFGRCHHHRGRDRRHPHRTFLRADCQSHCHRA